MDKTVEDNFPGFNNRALQIILPDPRKQIQDPRFDGDMYRTGVYYLGKGYIQETIKISKSEYNEMLNGKLSPELEEKINWAKKAKDKFEIRLNQHSHFMKEGQPNAPTDVGKILINHGLNLPDFKEKCTLHWDACYSGRDNPLNDDKAIIKQLASYMSNEGVGGMHFKGPKFVSGVNGGLDLPSEPIGVSVIFRPGTDTLARMDEKNERGKYKFMTHLTTPPSAKVSKVIKEQRDPSNALMNYSSSRQNNASSSQKRFLKIEAESSPTMKIKPKKSNSHRLMR